MWSFCSTLRLAVAALWIHQIAAALETSSSYPSQIAQQLDLGVDPCHDFYQFSCGGYKNSPNDVPMPFGAVITPYDESSRFSLDQVLDKNRHVLLQLLQSNTSVGSKYFASCMNTKQINALGPKPLQQVLQQIDNVKNVTELVRIAGLLSLVKVNFLVKLAVVRDEVQPSKTLQLAPAYFPLGSVELLDVYLKSLEPAYRKYISTLLKRATLADPATVKQQVDTIVTLEKEIATMAGNHTSIRMTFGQAFTKYPLVQELVTGLFSKANGPLPDSRQFIEIHTPSFLEKLQQWLKPDKLSALKTLMKYHYIHAKTNLMGDQFTPAALEFPGNTFDYIKIPTRTQHCMDLVLQQLPNRMGKEYAALMFDSESANVANDMVSRLRETMKQQLVQTKLFDEPTRKKALEKLAKMVNLIGYSEEVEQIQEAKLRGGDFFGNSESIQRSVALQQIQQLGKPVQRGEWITPASHIETYYDPKQNAIAIPAGSLQPPNFHKSYPAAINYGATATWMARELIHAFAEWGSYHDGDGSRKPWWTKKTMDEFESRAQCLVKQYSNFDVVSHTNTSLVLGKFDGESEIFENFADVSGFPLAFETYKKLMESATPPSPTKHEPLPEMDLNATAQQELLPEMDVSVDIGPQSPHSQVRQEPTLSLTTQVSYTKTDLEKAFYVAYAQSMCGNLQGMLYLRLNGVLMNDKYFGNLFQCPVGAKMNPKDKCTLW